MQESNRSIKAGWQVRWHGKRASLGVLGPGKTRDAAGRRPRCWGQIGSSDSLPWRLEKTAASPCTAQRCHLRLVQINSYPSSHALPTRTSRLTAFVRFGVSPMKSG